MHRVKALSTPSRTSRKCTRCRDLLSRRVCVFASFSPFLDADVGISLRFSYPHDWKEKDLVLFHNSGVLHTVVGAFKPDQVRAFHQCNLAASDEPVEPTSEDMRQYCMREHMYGMCVLRAMYNRSRNIWRAGRNPNDVQRCDAYHSPAKTFLHFSSKPGRPPSMAV